MGYEDINNKIIKVEKWSFGEELGCWDSQMHSEVALTNQNRSQVWSY